MSTTVEALEAEALRLPAAERARLIERLITSLDVDPDVEEAWLWKSSAVKPKSRTDLLLCCLDLKP